MPMTEWQISAVDGVDEVKDLALYAHTCDLLSVKSPFAMVVVATVMFRTCNVNCRGKFSDQCSEYSRMENKAR